MFTQKKALYIVWIQWDKFKKGQKSLQWKGIEKNGRWKRITGLQNKETDVNKLRRQSQINGSAL